MIMKVMEFFFIFVRKKGSFCRALSPTLEITQKFYKH